MKRAWLIAGGTVGGLGAVLAITPPQLTSTDSALSLGGAPSGVSGGATSAEPTAPATTSAPATTATKSATPSKSSTADKTSAPVTSKSPANTAPTTQTPAAQNVAGTFTGDAIDVSYGIVQVQITVQNGKITDAQAVQTPGPRNDRYTNMCIPVMRQKTLAAQSSQITGVSGASYTSFGWYKSLQSALTKAGLPL